jgi:hypothetical protein
MFLALRAMFSTVRERARTGTFFWQMPSRATKKFLCAQAMRLDVIVNHSTNPVCPGHSKRRMRRRRVKR